MYNYFSIIKPLVWYIFKYLFLQYAEVSAGVIFISRANILKNGHTMRSKDARFETPFNVCVQPLKDSFEIVSGWSKFHTVWF